jgi:hypothetical protein
MVTARVGQSCALAVASEAITIATAAMALGILYFRPEERIPFCWIYNRSFPRKRQSRRALFELACGSGDERIEADAHFNRR